MMSFFQMDSVHERGKKWFTPRQNTDLQSEVLNIVAGPIYVYTITSVYIHGLLYLLPYFYKQSDTVGGSSGISMYTFQIFLSTVIYLEMMLNWLCIVFVDNSLKGNKEKSASKNHDPSPTNTLNVVVVDSGKKSANRRDNGVIPGPKSAPVQSTKQSYWSWKMCEKCCMKAPPRCHHCPMCDVCVLKRDHHCFFTRRCVGFYNQRHFIIFCAWASFGTTYATIHFLVYYYQVLITETSTWDVFAPFALLRWIFGDGSFAITNLMFTFTFNFLFIFLSTGFILDQIDLINKGLTQFEQKSLDHNKLNIVDPRPLRQKIRAVFGYNYGLSVILPFAHIFYPPHENPFEWPEVKVYRGKIK